MSKLSRRRLAPVAALNFEPLKVTNEENERSLATLNVSARLTVGLSQKTKRELSQFLREEPKIAAYLFEQISDGIARAEALRGIMKGAKARLIVAGAVGC